MTWSDVGKWLQQNAGTGAALVGSILTGNVPAAVGLGVKLVAGATGTANPDAALEAFKSDPATVVRLKELAVQSDSDIREHIEKMTALEMEDAQKEHTESQTTVRAGDIAQDRLVRWTRPLQSWASLIFAGVYAMQSKTPTEFIFIGFMTLPFTYFGLRQLGKWKDSTSQVQAILGNKSNG